MSLEEALARLAGSSTLGVGDVVARLGLTFLLTSAIAFLYSRNYRGYGRPNQMALVLVLVALATAGIISAIGDNLGLALGMVGALSIVRFRAAIKDNRDLAYLFWSLAVGLVCGTGAFLLALTLAGFVGVVAVALERLNIFRSVTRAHIVILSGAAGGAPIEGLLPADATLKSTVYQRDGQTEESTYLVQFADEAAISGFKERARAHEGLTGFQILGPEDTILG